MAEEQVWIVPQGVPVPRGTNAWARWAAVCGVVGVVPLALGFGVAGVVQTMRTGQRGLRLALFGVVAAVIWSAVVAAALAARG